MVSLQVNTADIMAMNRMDRIVLDPNRTYVCTRTARTGVRVTSWVGAVHICISTINSCMRTAVYDDLHDFNAS